MEDRNERLKALTRLMLEGSIYLSKEHEVDFQCPDMATTKYTISFRVMTSCEKDVDEFVKEVINDIKNIYSKNEK